MQVRHRWTYHGHPENPRSWSIELNVTRRDLRVRTSRSARHHAAGARGSRSDCRAKSRRARVAPDIHGHITRLRPIRAAGRATPTIVLLDQHPKGRKSHLPGMQSIKGAVRSDRIYTRAGPSPLASRPASSCDPPRKGESFRPKKTRLLTQIHPLENSSKNSRPRGPSASFESSRARATTSS